MNPDATSTTIAPLQIKPAADIVCDGFKVIVYAY